ncbi:LAQU0S07e02542g1_1 [Lachancea quebecensis]|uniref:LAQU0S07e02542g1_1 n=1 Tax=Lachancea quebecensis TaxID=1654605 RepID=A0A0P1KSF8_9SACH|nr:LAQU0S07e02542g1_1 [Lachancea quebecensis]
MFKIKIRSPEGPGDGHSQAFEPSWAILDSAIDSIYDGQVNTLSFELLYHTVYSMVLRKQGSELYSRLRKAIEEKLSKARNTIVSPDPKLLVSDFLRVWEKQCDCLRLVSDFTMYLDRVYCKENRVPFVYDLGLELFRDTIMFPLKREIHGLLIQQINNARLGEPHVDSEQLKEVFNLMETLRDGDDTYFVHEFEPFLIRETEGFYRDFAKKNTEDAVLYIQKIKAQLDTESNLNCQFLNKDTSAKILKVAEEIVIAENASFVVKDGLPQLLIEKDYPTLRLLFQLYHNPKDKSELHKQMSHCIIKEAMLIEEDNALKKKGQVAVKWTTKVMQLRKSFEEVFTKAGESGANSYNTISESFSTFLNQNGRKSAEYLAIYIDSFLRSSAIADNIDQMWLEDTVSMFKLLREKDAFEKVYKQQLSKRLLQQRSCLKTEKLVISKMKEEMGIAFTSKLEGMFKDILVSQGYKAKFEQSYSAPFDFEVNVLTPPCWPFQLTTLEPEVELPSTLERLKLDFENFYIRNHSGRSLRWAYHLGSMEIGFHFSKGYHEITMPVYAALIFMLFESHDELSADEISDLTKIPEHELIRHLLTISVAPKTRLLKKNPLNKTVLPTDRFQINYAFQAPTKKVKVLAVLPKTDTSVHQNTRIDESIQDLLKERRGCVDAAIVRALKSLKAASSKSLFARVEHDLSNRFTVTTTLFEESVERLVEREYIQRDVDDPSLCRYLP